MNEYYISRIFCKLNYILISAVNYILCKNEVSGSVAFGV